MASISLLVLCFVISVSARVDKYERLDQVLHELYQNETWRELIDDHVHNYNKMYETKQRRAPANSFDCHDGYTFSGTPATNVHTLRPENIGVVAALGDSLTAGNGILAWNIFQATTEYRGRAWSIGGEQNVELNTLTLPNFIKKFNPNVRGFSTGNCDQNGACAHLNVAEAGKVASDMPRQAAILVNKMQTEPDVDFDKDWKVVTLFIGGNDLCDFCNDEIKYSKENYMMYIRQALDILLAIPRTYVNLVEILDITPLGEVASGGVICNIVTDVVCGCPKDRSTDTIAALQKAALQYQGAVNDIVTSGDYERDDFTVVAQPFFRATVPPKNLDETYDMSYFCPDCFHFSERGTNVAGKSLWNNMFEGGNSKSVSWSVNKPYVCPGRNGVSPYLRTSKN